VRYVHGQFSFKSIINKQQINQTKITNYVQWLVKCIKSWIGNPTKVLYGDTTFEGF
jgi:hypothetical protein